MKTRGSDLLFRRGNIRSTLSGQSLLAGSMPHLNQLGESNLETTHRDSSLRGTAGLDPQPCIGLEVALAGMWAWTGEALLGMGWRREECCGLDLCCGDSDQSEKTSFHAPTNQPRKESRMGRRPASPPRGRVLTQPAFDLGLIVRDLQIRFSPV